jgi:hypothetical protein
MTVIIEELQTEVADAPRPLQPHEPGAAGATGGEPMTLDRLRAAMLRDAQRQARLWAD